MFSKRTLRPNELAAAQGKLEVEIRAQQNRSSRTAHCCTCVPPQEPSMLGRSPGACMEALFSQGRGAQLRRLRVQPHLYHAILRRNAYKCLSVQKE